MEDWKKKAVVRAVREICARNGVPTRLSFYETAEPDGLFFGEVGGWFDPIELKPQTTVGADR
jgi:hypothetical protein